MTRGRPSGQRPLKGEARVVALAVGVGVEAGGVGVVAAAAVGVGAGAAAAVGANLAGGTATATEETAKVAAAKRHPVKIMLPVNPARRQAVRGTKGRVVV